MDFTAHSSLLLLRGAAPVVLLCFQLGILHNNKHNKHQQGNQPKVPAKLSRKPKGRVLILLLRTKPECIHALKGLALRQA